MDDYSITSLQESRNEWCSRLINTLTPLVIEGFKSIFDEAWNLCEENDELEKYLMTYQNFLSRIPKWNPNIVDTETKRIVEKSNCGYLNDLISCVHIIQLKSLTCMRVGNKQKKIDINIPSLNDFIHKVYINTARKLYKNIYLYETNITPLQIQKHNREVELIVREEILNSIRDNIPVEDILKVYLDETIEEDVEVEEKEEIISTDPVEEEVVEKKEEDDDTKENENPHEEKLVIEPLEDTKEKIKFNDIDQAISVDKIIEDIEAPKTEERLEKISNERNEARKLEEEEDDEEDKITIGDKINLGELDVHDLDKPKELNKAPLGLEEIEILT
jgi:hypothetical protein|uniref:Uncharacterized protein n=1 Tax=viral metagenome TaxID=1070528 RepID=A0A6C0CJ71_9ZZZZ